MSVDRKVAVVVGLVFAALAQFLALLLAGAGHGWITPFYASIALWGLMPASFFVTARNNRGRNLTLVALATAAAGADIVLLVATRNEGFEYFDRAYQRGGFLIILVWLALWFSWQIVVIIAVVRRFVLGTTQ